MTQEVESYESVWDAIADTPQEAAHLRARADLMREIAAIVQAKGWTPRPRPRPNAESRNPV